MKFIKVFLLFAATLWQYIPVSAQQFLKGKVTDSRQESIPGALIEIQAADSTFLVADYADSTGNFLLVLPGDKAFFAKVSMIGYTPFGERVSPAGKDTLSLHVRLEPAGKMLEGVTIQSRKAVIERKADRTVFHVDNSISAIGSDAYDILKKTPGVQVSNGNVSITGKSTVSIMLNDRLVQVSGAELESMLRSMPAGNISRIEVITAPPAKYDAEGNSGIINMVTKKSVQNGFNGNVTLSYEQRTKGSQNLQSAFNYQQGKLNIYGNINVNRFRFISRQQTNTEYPEQKQEQILDQDNRPFYTWSQVGADYTVGPRSVIGFLYTLGTMDTKRDEDIRTGVLRVPSGFTDSTMATNAFATDKGRRNVFNLNYDWRIDSLGKKLSVNTDYFTRQGNKTRNFTTGNFYTDGTGTGTRSDNHTSGQQNTDIMTTRADLEWPTGFALLSAGAKASWIHNYSNNAFSTLSGTGYVTDAGKTNSFDYRENTQAVYISARQTWGKWNTQLGLRGEYTQTHGRSITLNQDNTRDYFKLFPSAYLQYKANKNHSWNINYTRRINRPSFWNMNPFRVYSTATAYEEGNPFLQPSFSNNIEAGYAFQSLLAFTAFVQKVDAYATRVSIMDTASNAFHFSQANAGNELQYGLTGSLSISPVSWWENTTQLSAIYNRFYSSYYDQQVRYGKPSFAIETGNTFTLNASQTLLAELNFEYSGRKQEDFDIQHSYCNLSAAIKVLCLHRKLTFALNMQDILKTDIWRLSNQYNGTFQNAYPDNRCLRLSLTWKFGNQSIKEKRARTQNTDESSRAS